MRKLHIAEWILRLVTSQDRASSTVGDLVEESATRGAFWFWSAVLRTAASLVWRGVAEDPARMTRVAVAGLAIDILAGMVLGFLSGIAFFVTIWSGRPLHVHSIGWTIALNAPLLGVSLWIGRLLARWAPGRELSACLAYAILGLILTVVLIFVEPGSLDLASLLQGFLIDTPVLAGALWGRSRRLA